MKSMKKLSQIALLLCALPLAASAGDKGVVYVQGSTNGLGIGYAKSVTNDIAVRGQYNAYDTSFSGDVGSFGAGSVADVQLKMSTLMVLGDWYPSDSGWRVTGGAVLNNNKINVNVTNATVNAKGGLSAVAEVKMADPISPYLGIGYSTKPKDAKGLGFNFDLGIMFQNPSVNLVLTGAGVIQADADKQLANIKDATDKLKYMPVIGVGVSYAY
jgi:hypothetical protein